MAKRVIVKSRIQYCRLVKRLTESQKTKSKTLLKDNLIEILAVVMDFKTVHDTLHGIFTTGHRDLLRLSNEFDLLSAQQIKDLGNSILFFLTASGEVSIRRNFAADKYIKIGFQSQQDEDSLESVLKKVVLYEISVVELNRLKDEMVSKLKTEDYEELSTDIVDFGSAIQQALQNADDLILHSLPLVDFIAKKI